VGKWEVVAVRRTSKIIAVVAATLVALAFGVGLADARAGKFSSTTTLLSSGTTTAASTNLSLSAAGTTSGTQTASLIVGFVEKGVGGNETISYEVDATNVTVNLACVNDGNNKPSDARKSITSSAAIAGTGASDSKGVVSNQPVAGAVDLHLDALTCPTGQTVRALTASVTGITINDLTNGTSGQAPDVPLTTLYATR
jgi:hypothetical protein